MLLIEKVANRVVRQNVEEVQNSLALPSSILGHNSSELQIRVCDLSFASIPWSLMSNPLDPYWNLA